MAKTLVITGGNKGIGLEITKLFLNNKFNVIVGARTSIDKILLQNKKLKFIKINAIYEKDHKTLINTATKIFGSVDVFINNVGISEWKPIDKIENKFLDKLINTNLKSYFWGCKVASNSMKNGGSIINISSIAGKRGSKNNSAYCATKFAITGLTQSLSKELGVKKIRVNAVCPVLIETEGLIKALRSKHSPAKGNIDKFLNDFKNNQSALNKLPSAKDVANFCLFLASENSSSVTGQSINIDCGVFPQ